MESAPGALIPHLWQQGMDEAEGDVVAITTTHFVPAADWIAQIRAAHQRHSSPAIGGRVEPTRGGGAVDWATFFLRYGKFVGWRTEGPAPDLAGDNASYKREDLVRHRAELDGGFWEPEFHRLVIREGADLIFVPAIRVTQHTSFGIARFCWQRYHHGRQFGGARARRWSAFQRALRLAASPLIPVVVLAKVVRQALHERRYFGALCCAFPVLACFVAAWSAGEVRGYFDRTQRK